MYRYVGCRSRVLGASGTVSLALEHNALQAEPFGLMIGDVSCTGSEQACQVHIYLPSGLSKRLWLHLEVDVKGLLL